MAHCIPATLHGLSNPDLLLARVIFQEITARHLRMLKEMEKRNKVYGIVFVVGYRRNTIYKDRS